MPSQGLIFTKILQAANLKRWAAANLDTGATSVGLVVGHGAGQLRDTGATVVLGEVVQRGNRQG